MKQEIKLSIVIPFYNEEQNIPATLTQLKKVLSHKNNIEIILVDNGSSDNSQQVFTEELNKINSQAFRLITVSKNLGYGHGILSGLSKASGELLSWTHADMQTDPLDLLKALEIYDSRSEQKIIVKGKRVNRKFTEAFFTISMQFIVFFILKTYLDDINAQPKLFSRRFYEQYIKDSAPNDFSLDLYLLYQAKVNKYKTLEIPVSFKDRIHGEAKGGGSFKTRIKLIKRTIQYIIELRSKLKDKS